ncbi:hypothetical protein [Paucibacter soli]|uniref:hypothetical protein n=1 Tax=Paucibacter soli TaxID=3133433 RepID=UPI00309DF033
MERLVEQLVAWHNRHPLALRIAAGDVHTLGVVALPFMRSSRPAEASEPTLTDEVSEEEALARAADAASGKAAAPAAAQPWWRALDPRQLFASPSRGLLGELPWPVFSERFIPGLRPAQVARFALAHAYTVQPGEADWPQRIVAIDESMVAKAGQGAWPMELYLASAGIDAGASRTRVLIGQGHGSELLMLGRRCLDKRRVAALGLLLAALLALPAWLLWPAAGPRPAPAPAPASASAAASAPPMAASAAPAPAPASAAAAATPASAVSTPAPTEEPASSPATAPATAPASAPAAAPQSPPAAAGVTASELPNELAPAGTIASIRPNMVSTPRTRKAAAEAASQAASQPARPAMAAAASAPAPVPTPAPAPATAPSPAPTKKTQPAPAASVAAGTLSGEAPSEAAKTATARLATRRQAVVALVGPSLASKSDAEAMLARMRAMVAQTVGDRSRLQAEVMRTPEGWRATVWPFATREEAQLINATLIARGMKTRAVDF